MKLKHGENFIIKEGQNTDGVFLYHGKKAKDNTHTIALKTIESNGLGGTFWLDTWESIRWFEPK